MKVLFLEEETLPISSIISLANESQQSKREHEKVLHCELDIDEYIYVFYNLISNGFMEINFNLKILQDFLKTVMCLGKFEFLEP